MADNLAGNAPGGEGQQNVPQQQPVINNPEDQQPNQVPPVNVPMVEQPIMNQVGLQGGIQLPPPPGPPHAPPQMPGGAGGQLNADAYQQAGAGNVGAPPIMNQQAGVAGVHQNAPPIGVAGALGGLMVSLTPYGRVLDLANSSDDAKLYNRAIEALDEKYDGDPKNMGAFVDAIKRRTTYLRCMGLFNIPVDYAVLNMFESYLRITITHVHAARVNVWNQNNWLTQAAYIMGQVIINSLTQEFRSRVVRKEAQYTYNHIVDAASIMRVIYGIVYVDTRSLHFNLLQKLATLKMEDYGHNVIKANEAFQDLLKELRATTEGRTFTDEQANTYLLALYKTAKNDKFQNFLEFFENSGAGIPNLDDFIIRAETKYNELKDEWNTKSKDEVIMALKADLKRATQKRKREKSPSKKKSPKSTRPKNKDSMDEGWREIPPKEGDKKIKVWNGKKWNWCKWHKLWVLTETDRFGKHSSTTCKLNPKYKDKKPAAKDQKKKKKQQVELNANAIDATDGDSSDDDSSSDSDSPADSSSDNESDT